MQEIGGDGAPIAGTGPPGGSGGGSEDDGGIGTRQPLPSGGGPGRHPKRHQTSVDDLEEEFLRKKKRELQQARMAGAGESSQVQQVVRASEKVGRNDPCPCGSGKKYKKCCGANAYETVLSLPGLRAGLFFFRVKAGL
jgi:preprotein translocase subunit SecA